MGVFATKFATIVSVLIRLRLCSDRFQPIWTRGDQKQLLVRQNNVAHYLFISSLDILALCRVRDSGRAGNAGQAARLRSRDTRRRRVQQHCGMSTLFQGGQQGHVL